MKDLCRVHLRGNYLYGPHDHYSDLKASWRPLKAGEGDEAPGGFYTLYERFKGLVRPS